MLGKKNEQRVGIKFLVTLKIINTKTLDLVSEMYEGESRLT